MTLIDPSPPFPLPPADSGVATWGEWQRSLDPARPPGDTPMAVWRAYISNAGRFIETWGDRAAAAGWSVNELFGAHPERPHGRVDMAGLIWFLREADVVDMTPDAAVIHRPGTGARQTYRRKK
jgi:hypothetical protein